MYRQIHSHTLLGHATGVRRFREMMASSTSGPCDQKQRETRKTCKEHRFSYGKPVPRSPRLEYHGFTSGLAAFRRRDSTNVRGVCDFAHQICSIHWAFLELCYRQGLLHREKVFHLTGEGKLLLEVGRRLHPVVSAWMILCSPGRGFEGDSFQEVGGSRSGRNPL